MSDIIRITPEIIKKLREEFEPLGITAYTNCCRHGCTGTYSDASNYKDRENGIYFFRLTADGMNWTDEPQTEIYASYDGLDDWESELALIDKYCEILGVGCKVEKPADANTAIKITLDLPYVVE